MNLTGAEMFKMKGNEEKCALLQADYYLFLLFVISNPFFVNLPMREAWP